MKKIVYCLLFILNTFSVYTWSTESSYSFLDDDPYATSVVVPNSRYAFTAAEFDFFLQSSEGPLISVVPAIQKTEDIDDNFIESALMEEREIRGDESRTILVPFMHKGKHWDALAVRKDHKGFKGFYARSHYDYTFMPLSTVIPILKKVYGDEIELQEIKGYHLVDYRPEDTGVVSLNNLMVLSGGSISESPVFSTLHFRERHITTASSLGEKRFLSRQTYNLPPIFYMNGGRQHRCHLRVVELAEGDKTKLAAAIMKIDTVNWGHLDEGTDYYLSLDQLFNGSLLDLELKDEISFPFRMKTKKQIPWTVLRFLPDIELGNIPTGYQGPRIASMIRHFFDYIKEEKRGVLGNISWGLTSLRNGNQTMTEEEQGAFEIIGRFAGWFYDYEIINDLIRRIEMIEKGTPEYQSMAILKLIQVAGEYFPYMTGWLLQNSEEGEGVTSLEAYVHVFSELGLRDYFSHCHLGLLSPTFRLEASSYDLLNEIRELKKLLIRARNLKDEKKREYIPSAEELEFILEDTFLSQRKVDKKKVKDKKSTLYKFLEKLKKQTSVSKPSVKEPSKIEEAGSVISVFLPDDMTVEETPLSLKERREALRKLLTRGQSYTSRYAGIDEYIEFVRNIRKNVGVSIEEDYYWSETPSYSEILFFRKLGCPLLTGEEKRQARHKYAEDVLQAFDNLRRFAGIDETLKTLAARREDFRIVRTTDDIFYNKILRGEFEGFKNMFGEVEERLKTDFEKDPAKHLGVELLFGAVIEQMKHLFYFPEFKGKFGERWQIRNYYHHPLPHGKTPLYLIDNMGKIVNWFIDPAPHRDGGRKTLAQHLAQISIVIPWIIHQNFGI